MGDHCNVAFYESEPDDLRQYQFLMYRRRGGTLEATGPLLALCLLEVYEMFLNSRELIRDSTEKIKNHVVDRLSGYGLHFPNFMGEDILTGEVVDVDFFYAVYSDYDTVGKIDVYTQTTENWEIPLPNLTKGFLDLQESRNRDRAQCGLEPEIENYTFGLRKIKSIDLLGMLTDMPRY